MTAVPSRALNVLSDRLSRYIGIARLGEKAHRVGRRLRHVRGIDDLYVSLVSEWTDMDPIVIGAEPRASILDDRSRWPKLPNPVSRMMAIDSITYLPDDILVKVDRASMAVSLESRAPFLDRDVVEFAWTLPLEMKLRSGQGKWILRALLGRLLPSSLVERPKMGFGVPLDQWLRGSLREWAGDLLNESRIRGDGLLRSEGIAEVWRAHQRGEGDFGYRLWSVLMFQAWLRATEGDH